MKTIAAGAVLAVLIGASAAHAAAPSPAAPTPAAAAPAPPPIQWGPALPGVCVVDGNGALRASAAGIAATAQLQGYVDRAKTEIAPTGDALDRDEKALAAAKATLPPAEYQTRAAAINARKTALLREVAARNAQIAATRTNGASAVTQLVNAATRDVASQRHCSMVLERRNIFDANPAMDITEAVVQVMNARNPSFQLPLAPRQAPAR